MRKKSLLSFFMAAIALIISSCSSSQAPSYGVNEYTHTVHSGDIASFALLSPSENQIVTETPTFKWEKAENADTYTLEVASTTDFSSQEDKSYVKKSGIVATEFSIASLLKQKDATYYWRVTAQNSNKTKKCANNYGSFFLKANTEEEIPFSIEYADEWVVHSEGSQASVSIDNNNFFNNNKKALAIKFNEEDTNQGIPSSDGWMVITHQQETEMYGVDSFYFNFYYSGQNARVFLRVVDEDNEYYNAEIKLANNVKQTVIMRFDEFTLRTKGGTTIANQKFDYNYIKYVELVFEETFGDGICMISDLKAVNFENYKHMFIQKLNFNDIDKSAVTTDHFDFERTYSEDGTSMTMSYTSAVNGYGFVKVPVNKFMATGDALKVKVTSTAENAAGLLVRIIEEDKDRWVYSQTVSTIPSDGVIIIPYSAFTLSEYHGDGSRQFYYLNQIQFGVNNTYSKGSLTFSDIEIVKLADCVENLHVKDLNNSAVIEDFESYTATAQIYYKWRLSTSNKDEAIGLNKSRAFGNNNKCGSFGYKSDMGPALYGLQVENAPASFNSLSFWSLDDSIKYEDAMFNHIDEVAAKMTITLVVTSGEEYVYVIPKLNKYWTNYVISFADFSLTTTPVNDTVPLLSENVVGVIFGLQYYYYLDVEGKKPQPMYKNNNQVYFDNIKFSQSSATVQNELAHKITPTEDNANISIVDDFNSYTNENINTYWAMNNDLAYSELTMVEENNNSYMKMKYKGATSVSYSVQTLFANECKGKAFMFDLKGDGKATVYFNIYVNVAGSNMKYRATITKAADSWNTYTIGLSKFVQVEGTTYNLSSNNIPDIYKISIGIVNSTGEESYIYIDNIRINYGVSYSSEKIEPIGG